MFSTSWPSLGIRYTKERGYSVLRALVHSVLKGRSIGCVDVPNTCATLVIPVSTLAIVFARQSRWARSTSLPVESVYWEKTLLEYYLFSIH